MNICDTIKLREVPKALKGFQNVTKVCSKCKKELDLIKFSKDKTKKDGYRPNCKTCKSETDSIYRKNNLEKIKKINNEYAKEHKEEANKRAKKWYIENKDYAIKYRRKHYNENKEQYKINRKAWNLDHPEFLKTYFKDYHTIRKSKDPNYTIRCSLRTRFTSALVIGNEFNKYFEFLSGCKMDYMRKWLEINFEDGFTWENHGKVWHIDHIIPVSFYDLTNEENLLKCFNWSNVRPCTVNENLKKSNKIEKDIIAKYQIKALFFELKSSVPKNE